MRRIVFYSLIILLLTSVAKISSAQTNDANRSVKNDFVNNGDQIFAYSSKLAWMRCSVGMTWDGKRCNGQIGTYSLAEARRIVKTNYKGWRIPTAPELSSLLKIKSLTERRRLFPGFQDLGEGGSPYWTSSSPDGFVGYYLYIDMFDGVFDIHSEGYSLAVILVRDLTAYDK